MQNIDADSSTAPSLNLTAEEKRVFGQLFRQADTESIGVVTGEVAVKFFEKTRLDPRVLGEVCLWAPIDCLVQERSANLELADMADRRYRE